MNTRFIFHEDAGHGWLEVTREDVDAMGLLETITPYSYASQDGLTLYLEEDLDAPRFLDTWESIHGTPELETRYTDWSFIRMLPHYQRELVPYISEEESAGYDTEGTNV